MPCPHHLDPLATVYEVSFPLMNGKIETILAFSTRNPRFPRFNLTESGHDTSCFAARTPGSSRGQQGGGAALSITSTSVLSRKNGGTAQINPSAGTRTRIEPKKMFFVSCPAAAFSPTYGIEEFAATLHYRGKMWPVCFW